MALHPLYHNWVVVCMTVAAPAVSLLPVLRMQVIAELGPGGWFGGGEAIYGSGPLQSALCVVAVGPDCAVVHVHLSGLQKHGGPELIK
jgi:hypothetical protein